MTTKLNLIFDLDGTLIDSSVGVIESVNYALEMTGQPVETAERIKRYIGSPLDKMFADFTDTPYETLLSHFRVRAREAVVREAEALEGVDRTLATLSQQGYLMGIATTKVRSQTDDIVARLNWDSYFKAISGGDEVTNVKPAPDIFLLSLDRMAIDGTQTIVIGDTANDVLGARAAGLKVIAIASDFGDPKALADSKPDFILDRFEELPDYLDGLSRNWLSTGERTG